MTMAHRPRPDFNDPETGIAAFDSWCFRTNWRHQRTLVALVEWAFANLPEEQAVIFDLRVKRALAGLTSHAWISPARQGQAPASANTVRRRFTRIYRDLLKAQRKLVYQRYGENALI